MSGYALGLNSIRYFDVYPKPAGVPAANTINSALIVNPETAFAWTITLPGGALALGSVLDIEMYGVYTSVLSLPLTLKVKLGSVIVGSAVFSPTLAVTNSGWNLNMRGIVSDTALMEFQGQATFSNVVNIRNTGGLVIDPAIDQTISVTAQFGALTLGASVQLRQLTARVS